MVKDALLEILPPDLPRLVRWRLTISLAIAMLGFHVLWACGMVPGVPGFARADELDAKISEALEPLYSQVGQLSKQQAETDEVVKEIRADQLANRIRELHALRCATADHDDRERLQSEIDAAQRQYRALMGERYNVDGCSERVQ